MVKKANKRCVFIPAVMLVIVWAGLLAIWHRLDSTEDSMLDLRTETTAQQVAYRLEGFINSRLHLVRQLAQLWMRNQIGTPDRFSELVMAIESEFTSIQAINWIDSHGVIRWVSPEDTNQQAKGRDIGAHSGLGPIVADAARTQTPRASFPLDLFQGGRGFGTYFPLVRDGNLEGYINGVFRIDKLASDCLEKGVLDQFYLRIADGGSRLFIAGPLDVFDASSRAFRYPLRVLDREWVLTLVPKPGLELLYRSRADEILLITGLLLAAGMALMFKSYLQRQRVLEESEQRLRLAVENMPAMVAAFDRHARVLVWNRHCEQVTGYTAEQIVNNLSAMQLLQPKRVDGASESNTPFGLDPSDQQEWIISDKDGANRTISWSNASAELAVPGWEAWGVGFDVTERRKSEDALKLTQFAMDRAAVATFWIVEDSGFTYVNQAACDWLGYTAEELLTLKVIDIDPLFDRARWESQWAEVNELCGKPRTFETVHRRKDGSEFPVEITASALNYKGTFYHFAVAKDITERKQAEQERLKIERALLEAQRLESLGLLAGGVAHDFNNLLTAMLGSVSLARGAAEAGSPLAENLQHVESAAQQAADLARQLLAYSGRGKFVVKTLDLRKLIEETGHLLRVSIPKRVEVSYEMDGKPVGIEGDPTQIRQIVMNLVINAAEAIGDVNGKIVVRASTMELHKDRRTQAQSDRTLKAGRYAMLEVSDTGCGLSPQAKAKIFEPFYSTKVHGRGLGLAAVMGIVRGHQGDIEIESELGRGTTIRVLLPSAAGEVAAEPQEKQERAPSSRTGGTVLVIDDEQSVRLVAKVILEDRGFTVLAAEDGVQGVEVFEKQADQVRVVLLDMTMPRMDGRQTLEALRRIRPDVRILLSSGYDETATVAEVSGGNITDFIQKPYRADQLLEKLQGLIAR